MQNVNDVAAAILTEAGPVDTWKLQKLLYYSQAWHLAISDEPLFDDPVEAWQHGPVVDTIYQQHRGKRWIAEWPAGDERQLGQLQREVVALVCAHYGDLSGGELSTLAHAEAPWQEARGDALATARLRTPISLESMKRSYRGRALGGRTSQDLAAGGIALAGPGASGPQRIAADRAALAELRDRYRQSPSVPQGYSDGVIGRGQTEMPSAAALERIASRRQARTC